MQLSHAVNKVIDLAHIVREHYAMKFPKGQKSASSVAVAKENIPAPPEENELREFLSGLAPEMIFRIMLIMCLGRGDFAATNLVGFYQTTLRSWGTPQAAIEQIMEKSWLPAYLVDGLEELRIHLFDVDNLPLPNISPG